MGGKVHSPVPAGGGEMDALIRAFDWSKTSIGPIARWPQSLRTTVGIVLRSPAPLVLLWGRDGIMIYNDAYSHFAGGRHPNLLGSKVLEGWPEVADLNRRVLDTCLRGETLSFRDAHLVLHRPGQSPDVWVDLDYSPVLDESGMPAGVLAIVAETTERVRAEQALRESMADQIRIEKTLRDREAELARVQQIGRVGGVEVYLRGGFQNRRSPEYLAIHGLPPEAASETHEDWVRRIHPEDRERAERQFLDAIKGDVRDYQAEYRIIRPSDGQVRWISVKAEIERDEAGQAVRLVGAHMDVTDAKASELAVRESEERFRLIANSAPVPIWVTRLDRKRAFVNQAYMDFLGLGYEESLEFDWRKALHPEDLPRILQEQIAGEGSMKPFALEARYRRADGEWRWLRSESQPRWGPGGEHTGFIGVAHDITAAKQAELELRGLNERLEAEVDARTRERDRIWNVSQDLLVVADSDGTWLNVNPAIVATLGWSAGEVIGKTPDWLTHPDDLPKSAAELTNLAAGGKTLRFENRLRHKDGSYRWLSWTAAAQEGHIYAVARDVTEEKQAAETLRRTEEALRHAQKMEAVGQLTGGIAHDFNNLLQGIIGSLDLIEKRLANGRVSEVHRFVSGAMTSANRAAALTHRLLAFSRRQPLDPKPVRANPLITSMEDLVRRTMGESIELELALAGGLWMTLCDQNQLENSILNLVINARDAMPDGGKLTIRTRNARIDADYAAARTDLDPGDYVCIAVSDTGTGMSADVAARAFEPFFTTKPTGQGTGLGLSMVYGFARQSGGHIEIGTEVGKGTTIELFLPRVIADFDLAEAAQGSEGPTSARGETILVVEDETIVRSLVINVLEEMGFNVLEAADGLAGLRILQSAEPVDLLITDIGLPGLNGRQLFDAARLARPELRVLFMTGYAESATLSNGVLGPGMQLITKPFAMDALSLRLRELLPEHGRR